jgi:hypothetical protein
MKANLDTPKKIGDVITSYQSSKTGQIVDIDLEADTALVNFGNDIERVTEWISLKGNNYFKREYKIMNLTQHPNFLVAEMSHIEKVFDASYVCYTNYSLSEVDVFLIPLDHIYAQDFIKNPDENKLINFVFFFLGKLNFDGNVIDAYYSTDLASF